MMPVQAGHPVQRRREPWPANRHQRAHAGAAAGMAALAAITTAAPTAAVTVNYIQIDADGPPKLWGKAVGDLDGDGLADLIVASAVGPVVWYQNRSKAKHVVDQGTMTRGPVTVADLDGVNGNDIIVPAQGGAVWFANNGRGTAWRKRLLVPGLKYHDVKVADLDGDGKLDVVARGEYPSGGRLPILRQVTPTAWAETTLDVGEAGTGLLLHNIDRGGRPDLVVGKYWYRNDSTIGNISFTGPFTYHPDAQQDAEIGAGDIDGDGRPDLFVTSPHLHYAGGKNAWYSRPADPTGLWRQHVLATYERRVFHTALVVDIDWDGDRDLVTAMMVDPGAKIEIYFNQGQGRFAAPFVVANVPSHAMKVVWWGGKISLFGSEFTQPTATSVDLWQLSP